MEPDLLFFGVLVLLLILTILAARSYLMTGLVLCSFLIIILPIRFGVNTPTVILSLVFLGLLGLTVWFIIRKDLFRIDQDVDIKRWRVFARPLAFLFIPINIYMGHRFLLLMLGILSIISIGMDLYRLITRRKLALLFKKKEVHRFSSMTAFLVAVFIIFLLFPFDVAYLCLGFIIMGDLLSKIMGLIFGRTRLLHDRTLEGSLGFLTGSLSYGFVVYSIFEISIQFVIIGSVCATLIELFSFALDDNFTVGILTGGCLMALRYFLGF